MRSVLRPTRVRIVLALALAAVALVLLVPAGGALELPAGGQAPPAKPNGIPLSPLGESVPPPSPPPILQPQGEPPTPTAPAPGPAAPVAEAPAASNLVGPQTSEAANVLGALEPALPRMIVGTNGGSGWGATAVNIILGGHITWDRFSVKAWSLAVQTAQGYGFHMLGIINNINDATPLSAIEPTSWGAAAANELAAHPGIQLAEAANEAYLKGGVANPAQYGRMYLAAVKALKAKGIHTPLLFNMAGDYPYGSWASPKGWSEDAKGGGWLRDAVKAVPGLASAILENGISIHPYGGLTENGRDNWGVLAAAADERVAQAVLGAIPPFYITEFGYDLNRCGQSIGACTGLEQAAKLKAAYKAFEADPNVHGIWWYESHDDSTGKWGYLNKYNAKRPSFSALKYFALQAGQ